MQNDNRKKEKGEIVQISTESPVRTQLGNPEVFVRQTSEGVMKVVKAAVTLDMDDLYSVQGTVAIKATGYDKLNKVASISTINAPFVEDPVDGSRRPNPYIKRNAKGLIESVTIRKLAVGYSPIGNLAITDHTVEYSLNTYFIQDILAAMKRDKNAARRVRESQLTEDDLKDGILIPEYFEPISGETVGLLLNMRSYEAHKVFKNHDERQQHAERRADTVARRNCLKRHPAIGVTTVKPDSGGKVTVEVFGFRSELDRQEILNLTEKVTYGRLKDETVEVERAEYHADTEDDIVASVDLSDSGDTRDSEITDEGDSPAVSEETYLVNKIRDMQATIGKERYKEVYLLNFKGMSGNLENWKKVELQKLKMVLENEVRKLDENK